MRMYDIIMKKRDGGVLSDEEIGFFVDGVVDGSIPDYQSSALLMAIYFRGLNAHETAVLTDRMAHSGDLVDLSAIHGFKADKHSTGGVGDKTTMIVGPIVASCGVPVAKMSGRGLGHTGGTVDKLESIPGFRVELSPEEFSLFTSVIQKPESAANAPRALADYIAIMRAADKAEGDLLAFQDRMKKTKSYGG